MNDSISTRNGLGIADELMIDISIVIVNWNTRDLLLQCLASVYDTVHQVAFEVIVVDNASSDSSPTVVRERFPQVRWIENQTNVGFARANNQALRLAQGRYFVLLNSDAVVQSGAVERIVKFLDATPDAGVVGPKLLNPDGSFQASYGDFPNFISELASVTGVAQLFFGKDFPSHSAEQSNHIRSVDWVGGACLAGRHAAIAQVGLLDETYFMYSEEMDWCYRFRQCGWNVYYLPEAQVIHWKGQSSLQADDQKLLWLHQGRVRFYAAHHNPAAANVLWQLSRLMAGMKAGFWLFVSLMSDRRREIARRKVRANWRVATFGQQH